MQAFAQDALAGLIYLSSLRRPLVLGLGLKHYSMPALQAVARHSVQQIRELLGARPEA